MRHVFPTSQIVLKGKLETLTPLHIGGYGHDPNSDQTLIRDGQDRFLIPGTSLAGAFRDWCHRHFDEQSVHQVWGSQNPDSPNSHASRLLIDDIAITDVESELRDGVQIDRDTGTAASKLKYDRVILPRNLSLDLKIIAEPFGDDSVALGMLTALKLALETGEIRLGAAKTRGLGSIKLTDGKIQYFPALKTREGIFKLLENQPAKEVVVKPLIRKSTAGTVRIAIHWKPIGPLMVKASQDGVGVDMLPLTSGNNSSTVSLVLPGSSIKGAFRAKAEQIIRTLLNPPVADTPLNQIDVPLVDAVFGSRGKSDNETTGRKLPHLGLGALAVDDCYAEDEMSQAAWSRVQNSPMPRSFEEEKLLKQSDLAHSLLMARIPHWHPADHVAIDRWTGGAADQMLYSVLEPTNVAWEPIRLSLRLDRLIHQDTNEQLPGMMLLCLVLRELASNRLPLGFATHRGMGTLAVSKIEMTSATNAELNHTFINGDLSPLATLLNQPWNDWLNQQTSPEGQQ